MNIGVEQQTYMFLVSVFGGLILGLIYDAFRVFRKLLKSGKKITFILDIVFWIIAAGVCFYFMKDANDGQFRGFIIIGFVMGFTLYYVIVGNKFLITMHLIITKLIALIIFIIKLILKPFAVVLKILKFIFSPIGKLAGRAGRSTKKRARFRINMLTRDMKKSFNIIKHKK